MKSIRLLFLLAFSAAFILQSCMKDDCERTVSYIEYTPIYKTLDEIHSTNVVQEAPRELESPGQFYYFNDHIFINERGEGVHVIDNTNPRNPVNIQFLSIPGNENMAVKNGLLYANSYTDLVVVDLNSFELAGRVEDAFLDEWMVASGQNEVLVDWLEIPKTEVVDCATFNSFERVNGQWANIDVNAGVAFDDFAFQEQSTGVGGNGTGTGGSMARFTIMSCYLYAIDNSGMELFDLNQPTAPVNVGRVDIGRGIETIFPYEDKLFIGSNTGMFIYDNSDPTQPTQLSAFAHATSCDPVYVQGDRAYVTLRSGNWCDGFSDQLDLIDISNLTNPVLLKTFPMDNPHGLTIHDNHLFLCEGEHGVKSFDISDPLVLGDNQRDHVKGLHAFDAISLPGNNDVVMVIGDDGFYQYEVDGNGDMKELSKISIKQ